MKNVTLKTNKEFSDKEVLITITRNASGGARGMTVQEMRQSIRLLDVLEPLADDATSVTFEDSDFNFLADRLRSAPYTQASRELLDLIDRFIDPPPSPATR